MNQCCQMLDHHSHFLRQHFFMLYMSIVPTTLQHFRFFLKIMTYNKSLWTFLKVLKFSDWLSYSRCAHHQHFCWCVYIIRANNTPVACGSDWADEVLPYIASRLCWVTLVRGAVSNNEKQRIVASWICTFLCWLYLTTTVHTHIGVAWVYKNM